MRLSQPIFQLKRRARQLARAEKIPLHIALDRVAQSEGFSRWSLLAARISAASVPEKLFGWMKAGEMLLIAGRPGHGKTRLGLELLLEATRNDRGTFLFTLEFTENQVRNLLLSLCGDMPDSAYKVDILTSDEICADFIVRTMSAARPGAVAIVDYLQLLDQQREKPLLSEQLETLASFGRKSGTIFGFISQIDRAFEESGKAVPDIGDIRLPNSIDLGLFSKACFLHNGQTELARLK